ncbi:RHS repeat-associated core domain [Sphingobacterium spiritivorum]|uniref:RHS repeat-associated core domain n=1 Tax=Sphingobacterium spiritivorum TaxID=258 RepID=A0A380BIS3_SPHSI|nr:RHS repeat-associated core domain-containing protein [Sphingobacterium spiritivorum]SUJ01092.1 RHS repeat-associated core domain [Sphingobacterium spiritivorum]
MGRSTSIKQQINGQNLVTISTNNYNEIGQLVEKQVGADDNGGNSHANIQYTYNERGWLNTSISDFFSLKLKYGDGNTPQWNGNISEQQWGQTVSPGEKFVYEYDQLSRLKNGTSPSGMSELLNYDEMGNITKLIRDGASIDYTYSGNKLSMVSGTVNGNYAYDNNGNVSADRNGLNYVYTHFNIPKAVNGNGKTISYLYDANGIKLRKISNETGIRDYIGNIEYQNGNIALIRHAEGVAILKTDGTYIHHYNLTDHLGNVRATLYRNPATNQVEALQRDDYYPFGLRKVLKGGNNKYLYNGKEIQGELGDQYDYGARFYDPVIARWGMVDPLAEQMRRHSPYNYAFNNPLRFIDPDGMGPTDIVYFNRKGQETSRVISKTEFKTYVKDSDGNYQLVAMPNVITGKGGSNTTGAVYQKYDYQIAASTAVFNMDKNEGSLSLVTDGGKSIPSSATSQIPDLDPTTVKAIAMQESGIGTGKEANEKKDIMQVNNGVSNFADYSPYKANYGLSKGAVPGPVTSINAGIKDLATKGFKGGVGYNPKTDQMSFKFQGWDKAINNYNGGGAAKYGQDYLKSIKDMIRNSVKPTSQNY